MLKIYFLKSLFNIYHLLFSILKYRNGLYLVSKVEIMIFERFQGLEESDMDDLNFRDKPDGASAMTSSMSTPLHNDLRMGFLRYKDVLTCSDLTTKKVKWVNYIIKLIYVPTLTSNKSTPFEGSEN